MRTHPNLDTLQTLRLTGMYQALVEPLQMPDIAPLTFEERFGLLVDRECTERAHRRLTTRVRQAKRRQTASPSVSKISTIGIHGDGISPSSPASPHANGCGSVTTSSSPARQVLAKPGWVAR